MWICLPPIPQQRWVDVNAGVAAQKQCPSIHIVDKF